MAQFDRNGPGAKLRAEPSRRAYVKDKLRLPETGSGKDSEEQEENTSEQVIRTGSEAAGEVTSQATRSYYRDKLRQERGANNAQVDQAKGKKTEGSHAQSKKKHKERVAKSGSAGKSASKTAKGAGTKAAEESRKLMQRAVQAVAENPGGALIVLVVGLILIVVIAIAGMFGLIAPGGGNAMLGASYTAQDMDILGAEEDYCAFEEQIKSNAYQAITTYPDYNEYAFHLDEIGHDPHVLASYLTVTKEDYTQMGVKATSLALVQAQYKLEYTREEQIRTRWVTKTKWETRTRLEEKTRYKLVWDAEKKSFVLQSETYMAEVEYQVKVTYQEEEEYTYHILHVNLTNYGLEAVVDAVMTAEQKERYQVLLSTKGNKSYLFE